MVSRVSSLWPSAATVNRRSTWRHATAMACVVCLLITLSEQMALSQTEDTGEVDRPDTASATKETEPSLDYVTILCPEDREAEWRPKLRSRLVAPSEFSEMLRRAHPGSPPSIQSARYEARFEKDELVDGRAMLSIEHWSPHEAVLPLTPWNLAIERAGWADRDSEAARLGLAAKSHSALLVVHGGMLDVDWSLKGTRVNQDAVSFRFELPPCPSSQVLLTVPDDRIPVVSKGIVTRQEMHDEGQVSPDKGMTVWQIELGGENRFSLRIGPRDDPEGHNQSTELRQKSVYRLSPAGLEATVTLRLDVLGQQPLRRLELLVASDLNLVSVQEGDVAVPWGEAPVPGTSTKRVVIEPDSPLLGMGHELTLKALGTIQQEKSWSLPGLTVTGVHWCESVASLIVQHPLRLNDLALEQGRISQVRPMMSQIATDAIDLQLFSADARIDVVLGQKQAPPRVGYGVAIEMSGGQIAGHQTVRLEANEGEHFQIVGELGRSWVIDAINSSGMLTDWRIEPKGRTKRQLVIDLAQPLTSDAPIQFDIRARRLESTEGRRYSSRDVIPVEFESCRLETALVAVHALEPYQIELSGTDELALRESQDLSLREQQLFPEKLQGKIYLHDGGDERLKIRVRQRRSLYSAEIDVSVSVSGLQATEDYVFRIHPESARLESLAVELLKRPGAPLRWEPALGDETRLDAESSDTAPETSASSRLERWNLRLRPSRSETFEIRARRVFTVEDGLAIGLARLPDAAQQKGRLSVGVCGDGRVRIENRALVPVTAPPLQHLGEIPQSVYQYDPRRSLVSGKPPILLRVDTEPSSLPKAWIWLCQLESRLEPTGNGRHVATYRVENSGAPVLHFALPASIGVDLIESVEMDGRRAPLESSPLESPARLAIRLDGDRRFREVTICYRTAEAAWAPLQGLEVPMPEPDCPVLKRKWIVWLPPGRQMIQTEGIFALSSPDGRWPEAVWGPMLRRASGGPADPFVTDSWNWRQDSEPELALASPSSPTEHTTDSAPADGTELSLHDELPWNAVHKPGYEPRDTVGWTVHKIDLNGSEIATALVVDRNLLLAGLWFFFLLVTFATWTVTLRYPLLAFLPVVGFLLGGAYLPEFWAPWLSAGFWGSCAGLMIRLVAVRRGRSTGRVVATRTVTDSTSIAGAMCLITLLLAPRASAQTTAPESPSAPPALVLVPVGDDGKPTGKKYSVPESFYLKLQQRAQKIAEETPGWLLKDAYYHGSLSWQATGKPLTVTEFTAEFGIEVIRANEPVEIPLGATAENWTPQAVLLDGGQVDHTWDEAGKLVFFPTEPAQSSRLTLKLVPIPGYGIEQNGFRLNIPPLATSRLELSIPAGAPHVEVPSAMGRIRQQPMKLEADLGPIDQLIVKWQPTSRTSGGKVTRVDELMWLNLTLGGAVLDAQFRFDLGQDFEGELQLAHDPRLIQRALEVEGATLQDTRIVQNSPRLSPDSLVSQPLTRQMLSLTDHGPTVIVRAQFVVPDVTGIGSLPLPDLRSVGCEVARRWAAATVDPRLDCEQSTRGTVQKISASDFVDAWGGEVDVPTAAFQLDDDDASFALTTHPKPAKSSSQWELDVHYGLQETLLEYRANIDTSEGYVFTHRMNVPPALEIDDVTAAVNDVPCAVRWTRPNPEQPEQIVLFFDAPVRGKHSIKLNGRTEAKGERTEPLQLVEIRDAESEAGIVNIYRHPEAIVELEAVKGMTKVAERLGPVVMRWVVDDLGTLTATAHITPNNLKIVAHEQVISLRQTSDGWHVDVDCDLEVVSGMVDRIYMEVSELWPGPYVVSAGVTEEPTRGERGELVLRVPPRDRFKFRVSGPLVPKAGGRISVPRIRLKNVEYSEQTSRLIVLPAGPAPAIRWDVLGLTLTDVPSQFVPKSPGLTWNAYRVQQDDFLATVRPSPNAAQVHLADIRLAWDANGQCRGVAVFDLEAGDLDSCILHLPEPWRLVAVSSHGTPVSPQLQEEGSWAIPLGRTVLPQRFELVFTGCVSRDNGIFTIDMFPQLIDLPVRKTLWSFAGNGDFDVAGAGERISGDAVAMERLRNVTDLLNPANRRSGSSLDEDETWYRGWLGEWVDARRQAQLAVAGAEGETTAVRAEKAELEALDAAQQALAEQLDAKGLWHRLMETSSRRVTPGTLWDQAELGMVSKYYSMTNGSAPAFLRIESPETEQDSRFLLSPVLYVSACLLVLLVVWATGQFHRWPHFFGVVLGLSWWLWFWPSFLGLLLVAVFIGASLRSGWRRPRSNGSAIVRLSASARS